MAKRKSNPITVENMQDFFKSLSLAVVCGILSFFSFLGVYKIESITCCPEWTGVPLIAVGLVLVLITLYYVIGGFTQILCEE